MKDKDNVKAKNDFWKTAFQSKKNVHYINARNVYLVISG